MVEQLYYQDGTDYHPTLEQEGNLILQEINISQEELAEEAPTEPADGEEGDLESDEEETIDSKESNYNQLIYADIIDHDSDNDLDIDNNDYI